MGMSFRKSISAGPLRFNLSTSGIGVSAGVRGLRVGSGPRGGYVSAGRGGVYYRKSLGSPRWTQAGSGGAPPIELPVVELSGDDLEGADVAELVEALPSELIERIQTAALLKKPSWIVNPFTYRRRKLEWQADKAVPLFYEVDDELHTAYEVLVAWSERLGAATGRYYDRYSQATDTRTQYKGHGGATSLVDRVGLDVRTATPPDVTLNFEPPEFAAPERSMYVLPDQVLVKQGGIYGSLSIGSVEARIHNSNFITTTVPAGVTPIGWTWQYANKSGGPDLRYKVNPQLPIIEIAEIDFYGPAGFQFHTAFTDLEAAHRFGDALAAVQSIVPKAV